MIFKTLLIVFMSSSLGTFSQASSLIRATLKPQQSIILDTVLNEISGLAVTEQYFWGVNDSGGKAKLYSFDKENGKLAQAVTINNALNIDWEDLAQDKDFIYIGDTGNNFAIRQSIDIYKVSKPALEALAKKNSSAGLKINSQKLTLKYADKQNILPQRKHNFDSEALVAVEDQLWLFSKNRQDYRTKLYLLDKNLIEQRVSPAASFAVQGLITAADYNTDTKQLLLLGYSKSSGFNGNFIWQLNIVDQLPDWRSAKRFALKPDAQWESIKWLTNQQFMLAAEKSPRGKQTLSIFNLP